MEAWLRDHLIALCNSEPWTVVFLLTCSWLPLLGIAVSAAADFTLLLRSETRRAFAPLNPARPNRKELPHRPSRRGVRRRRRRCNPVANRNGPAISAGP
jgi:hypothetical protein